MSIDYLKHIQPISQSLKAANVYAVKTKLFTVVTEKYPFIMHHVH